MMAGANRWRILKRRCQAFVFDQVLPPPLCADIEPTTRCNLRCIMCQTPGWSRAGKDLSPDRLDRFLDQVPSLKEVKLQGMGEPLLHPQFFDLVRRLACRGIRTSTVTNGTQLSQDNRQAAYASGLDRLHVSIDTLDPSIFAEIRGGQGLESILRNVEQLARERPAGLRMGIMAIALRQNRNGLSAVAGYASQAGLDELVLQIDATTWGKPAENTGSFHLTRPEAERLAEEMAGTCLKLGLRFELIRNRHLKIPEKCLWPFHRIYLTCDGYVQPCCKLSDPGLMTLGPLEGDFESLWNGRAYRVFRRSHAQGQPPSVCRMCYE